MNPILRLTLTRAIRRASPQLRRILAEHATQTSTRSHTPLRRSAILIRLRGDLRTVLAEEHVVVVKRVLGLRHFVLLEYQRLFFERGLDDGRAAMQPSLLLAVEF